MATNCSCGDVLMVPIESKGHINPIMYLARGLLKRGITVSMLMSVDSQALLSKDVKDGLEGFNLLLMPSLKNGQDEQPGMTDAIERMERSSEPFFNRLVAEQESGVRGPKCVVADQFAGWTQTWADKLHIPRYVSFPSPASYAVTMLNHSSILAQMEKDSENPDPSLQLPGLPGFHLSDLPFQFRSNPKFREGISNRSGKSFRQAAGMLFNTFTALESQAIDSFRTEVEKTSTGGKVTKMLPIGPMLPTEFFSDDAFVGGTDKDSVCLQWLGTQRASSVLYIAFGSEVYLSEAQVEELAHGLEASHVPFLWILRLEPSNGEPGDVSKILPPGFQACTKNQGLVYAEFAPQLQILSHPATGGFLTHCGWNSCLEGISRGIPMVGWPMRAEQGLSCRLLVDELKAATEFKKKTDGSVERGEVERAIRLLMTGSEREKLKQRILVLQRQARAARALGGSSSTNFTWLAKEILGQH